jgi:hypothetical protein
VAAVDLSDQTGCDLHAMLGLSGCLVGSRRAHRFEQLIGDSLARRAAWNRSM